MTKFPKLLNSENDKNFKFTQLSYLENYQISKTLKLKVYRILKIFEQNKLLTEKEGKKIDNFFLIIRF